MLIKTQTYTCPNILKGLNLQFMFVKLNAAEKQHTICRYDVLGTVEYGKKIHIWKMIYTVYKTHPLTYKRDRRGDSNIYIFFVCFYYKVDALIQMSTAGHSWYD